MVFESLKPSLNSFPLSALFPRYRSVIMQIKAVGGRAYVVTCLAEATRILQKEIAGDPEN